MKQFRVSTVMLPLLILFWMGGVSLAQADPEVGQILERALERADWYRESNVEQRLAFRLQRVSEKLAGEGEVKQKEEQIYEVYPLEGALFEELVRKDGRPLTEEEEEEVEERKAEFIRDLRQGREPSDGEERQRVEFDERLVGKYDFSLEGIETVDGREAYRLAFEPKSDDLPVETRLDRALNNSVGSIWVDRETYEISRVEFRLTEKIGIWWGILGSISEMEGEVNRTEVVEGIWMPEQVEFYLNGRILFASLHRREKLSWSDFELRKDSEAVRMESGGR